MVKWWIRCGCADESSHRGAVPPSAPVEVLERMAVSCSDTGKVSHQLLECDHVAEALLLSTCNRVEVYGVVAAFHDGLGEEPFWRFSTLGRARSGTFWRFRTTPG